MLQRNINSQKIAFDAVNFYYVLCKTYHLLHATY